MAGKGGCGGGAAASGGEAATGGCGLTRPVSFDAGNKVAAKKQHRSYRSVRRLAPGLRRPVHDDISVIVLFIDHNLMERSAQVEEVSVKAFAETTESEFKYIYGGASTSATGPRTSAVGASTSAVGASASADDGASTSGPKSSTSAGGQNTADDGSSSSSE
ncbi:hypothetical protein L2E82_27972 [Cichorium intybus]|uniref:Uncharacterized protein n=1 Tax=Cichorium intybus TaxID=13427 RepID=A0ACB9CUE7_CICIN|nr:hypothetical protein L2E82_27972 [Cichorium intybus]